MNPPESYIVTSLTLDTVGPVFAHRLADGPPPSPRAQLSETVSPTGKLMLSVEEAARVLSIGRTVAYEGVRSGWLPTVRLGEKKIGVPWPRLWRAFFA